MKDYHAALAAMLLITGCRQSGTENGAAPSSPQVDNAANPNDYLSRIDALKPAQLRMVLFRAIRDAGQDCQDVTRTERLEDQGGKHLWRVTCRGGGQWAVLIGADGIANVNGPAARRP